MDILTGGCFCGAVRFEADGAPFHETNCHCSICRRTTGAQCVAWFSVRREQIRIVRGSPVRFHSTAKGIRSFCSSCGTQLTFEHEGANEIDITTCSLDDPERVPPKDHTRTSSKLRWVKVGDDLPEHAEARPRSHL